MLHLAEVAPDADRRQREEDAAQGEEDQSHGTSAKGGIRGQGTKFEREVAGLYTQEGDESKSKKLLADIASEWSLATRVSPSPTQQTMYDQPTVKAVRSRMYSGQIG